MRCLFLLFFLVLVIAGVDCKRYNSDSFLRKGKTDSDLLGPFKKEMEVFPVLPNDTTEEFFCPVLKQNVKWQETYIFNPAAIVKDGKVYLLFRGEDKIGQYGGTSRIGLAESFDGLHFTKSPQPVLFPDNDEFLELEKDGGVEDPRVVETEDGTYIMTYTAFNGKLARLCVATSDDLKSWKKHGLAFGRAKGGDYKGLWSKSGAIICRQEGSSMIATRINGKFWMYWGETDIFVATSDNLIDWEPMLKEEKRGKRFLSYSGGGQYEIKFDNPVITFKPAISIRRGRFDSGLVEPGPPAILTDQGIFFIYNASNSISTGDTTLSDSEYTVGQVLFDAKDPSAILYRCKNSFLKSESDLERKGQINNTAFVEGMVYFKSKWIIYYVMSEAKIGAAICEKGLFE